MPNSLVSRLFGPPEETEADLTARALAAVQEKKGHRVRVAPCLAPDTRAIEVVFRPPSSGAVDGAPGDAGFFSASLRLPGAPGDLEEKAVHLLEGACTESGVDAALARLRQELLSPARAGGTP